MQLEIPIVSSINASVHRSQRVHLCWICDKDKDCSAILSELPTVSIRMRLTCPLPHLLNNCIKDGGFAGYNKLQKINR